MLLITMLTHGAPIHLFGYRRMKRMDARDAPMLASMHTLKAVACEEAKIRDVRLQKEANS